MEQILKWLNENKGATAIIVALIGAAALFISNKTSSSNELGDIRAKEGANVQIHQQNN